VIRVQSYTRRESNRYRTHVNCIRSKFSDELSTTYQIWGNEPQHLNMYNPGYLPPGIRKRTYDSSCWLHLSKLQVWMGWSFSYESNDKQAHRSLAIKGFILLKYKPLLPVRSDYILSQHNLSALTRNRVVNIFYSYRNGLRFSSAIILTDIVYTYRCYHTQVN
jgi:hypothetical protein